MRRCGTWAKHAGVPLRRVLAVEGAGRLFSTPSRPALRRPPAAAVLAPGAPPREPGHRSHPRHRAATKHPCHRTKAPRALKALRRTAEPLPGLALVLHLARLMLVMELVLFRPTTTRAPNPRECASDPVEHGGLPSCVPQDATVLLTRLMNKG